MIECIETYDDRLKTESQVSQDLMLPPLPALPLTALHSFPFPGPYLQLLLNACLEMERPPRHAVFFDFSAEGIDCAHENDMRVSTYVQANRAIGLCFYHRCLFLLTVHHFVHTSAHMNQKHNRRLHWMVYTIKKWKSINVMQNSID